MTKPRNDVHHLTIRKDPNRQLFPWGVACSCGWGTMFGTYRRATRRAQVHYNVAREMDAFTGWMRRG